ncbi:MAG: CHAT domain-containing tetratricopeptide repeat protein [Bacteroidota bacterium]|nr:CHAT domain-containing tetratricopeptide repeat protein [Bacteroidota bacterium]
MRNFFYIIILSTCCNITSAQNNTDYYNLINLANTYYDAGEYEKGISISQKAVRVTRQQLGEAHPVFAIAINDMGLFYKELGQYKKADSLLRVALKIRETVLGKEHYDYAASLNNLANLFKTTGEYSKAEPLFIEAIKIKRKTLGAMHPSSIRSVHNLADLYLTTRQYEKAESLYLSEMENWKNAKGETSMDYTACLRGLANTYNKMEQYEKAESFYKKGIEINKSKGSAYLAEYVSSIHDYATMNADIGQYEKAETLYSEAMVISKKVFGESDIKHAIILQNLANLYRSLGQYEKAEALHLSAKEKLKHSVGETREMYSTLLYNLANLYKSMGLYEKSEPIAIEAKEVRESLFGEKNSSYAASLNSLAELYMAMGENEKAESLGKTAMDIFKAIGGENSREYKSSLSLLGQLYSILGQYDKAEPILSLWVEREKIKGGVSLGYATVLNQLTSLYLKTGKSDKAELLIFQNIQVIVNNIQVNFYGLSEQEKQIYIEEKISVLETTNSFLYNYKKANPVTIKLIANTQLLFKGLILNNTQDVLKVLRQSSDTIIQKLYKKWLSYKKTLAEQYGLPKAERKPDLKQTETEAERLEKQLTKKSTEFRKQQQSLQLTGADIQQKLEQDEIAIEFVRFSLYNAKGIDSVMYAAYVLHKSDTAPQFVSLFEEKQLQKLLDSAGRSATSTAKVFYRGLELKNKNTALGKDLYKLIWQPLEPYLKGVRSISYSPAGKLYGIAFHALAVDSTTLLMDKYQLQHYTSTRHVALRTEENKITKPSGIALFGDANFTMDSIALVKERTIPSGTEVVSTSIYTPPNRGSRGGVWDNLPGTAEEVKKIKGLFDQNKLSTKSFVQTTASEENLKALSGNSPQILHIATHGFFLPTPDKKRKETEFDQGNTYTLADDPLLRSGLILSGGNYAWSGKMPIDGVEDGIVTAYEISQMNLSNTELVVLSACETALGDVKGSEGVFGLQRAFKMAGVKKLIVSLWQVPDKETAELMTAFYTYWMKGKSINESFTQAQADMRKKYSPFYWAAFVLVE